MRVLLLEDEFMLAKSIRTYLLSQGHSVDYFDNGQELLAESGNRSYDCYILDINTPLMGGLECLENLVTHHPHAATIMISAYHDIDHISKAFSLGCNDYLKKPFNLRELDIRMKKIVRNVTAAEPHRAIIRLGDKFSFDDDRGMLYRDDTVQQLTKKEMKLLKLFLKNIGQIVSEDHIRNAVWEGEYVEASTIRSLVNRLRTKLDGQLIRNIRGFGYCLGDDRR